ncbi:MAG TPA: single-stranded DNA-binding protein [Dehalococcoidia bacterium]|nr:single-stranded DNA-binding protein [Dehalococcoidia bacterium]
MNGIACAFIGTLGADAELRFTSAGKAALNFSVAVAENRPNGDGATTTWVRCTAWEDLAERLGEALKKGGEVYVEGKLKLSTWTGQDGNPRTGLSVSAWTVQPLGAIGRRAPKRTADGRMDEWTAVTAGEEHQGGK